MRNLICIASLMALVAACGELPGQGQWSGTDRNDNNGYIGNRDDGLWPQAEELVLGDSEGRVTKSNPEKWFQIDLKAEQTLQVEINFHHQKGNLDLTIATQTMDFFLASVTSGDREYLAVTAPTDATYTVMVAGFMGDANEYRMTARVLEPEDAGCPAIGGLPPTRLANRLDDTVWTWDRFCRGQENEYEVELGLGEDLELSLMFDHRRGQINLEVFGPDGDLVLTGSGAPALKEAKLESALPGVYTVKVKGGAMDMPFTMSSEVADPSTEIIELDSICGDLQDDGVTLSARGERLYLVEVTECSGWWEKMTLHARLLHPGPEDYDLIVMDEQGNLVGNTSGYGRDVLELTHSSWSWGATNMTYMITVTRKRGGSEIEPHRKWTLDLRGYSADW